MCDTIVIMPPFTANDTVILAKNSDREPDEAQEILQIKRTLHHEKNLSCTFIQIPQVAETFEIILSKPFQMWGAEMGVNEWGVAIGNEAVFTKIKFNKRKVGLTGMDLLRLALERGKTAQEALEVIINLLEEYGQDACGGYKNKNFYYHNSFLITDPHDAYILDTAGKSWAYKKVEGKATISNVLNIGEDYEKYIIIDKPFFFYEKPKERMNFSSYFSDFLMTTLGRARKRRACTLKSISKADIKTSVLEAFQSLRTHHLSDGEFTPSKANTSDICMHATGLLNPSSTTGSMVVEIRKNKPITTWLTGAPHPCLSIFIPFYFQTTALEKLPKPSSRPDGSLWWSYKTLQDRLQKDYLRWHPIMKEEIEKIQLDFVTKEAKLINAGSSVEELNKFSEACLQQVIEWLSQCENRLKEI